MARNLLRRDFLAGAASAASIVGVGSVFAQAPARRRDIRKTLKLSMIPRELPIEERFSIAARAGFHAVEPDTIFEAEELESVKAAAGKAGVVVDGIICSRHWSHPLSDPDPKVVDVCMEAMRVSLANARELGGDMVLLVPAVVKPEVMYRDAYARSLARVKELAREAEAQKITIGIENVWNKFLLSPIEFRRYIEEVGSPFVRAWFDVGNIVLYGYPQDWIRTLSEQIARVDVKDFDANKREFVPLRQGSVDWPEVMRAFDEIGYRGYFAAEVRGGDLQYLTEVVSRPMDLIIAEA